MGTDYVRVSRGEIRQYECPECGAGPGHYCEGREEDGTNHRARMTVAQNAAAERRDAAAESAATTTAASLFEEERPPDDDEPPDDYHDDEPPPDYDEAPAVKSSDGFDPTPEQVNAVDLALTEENLAVEALAGTGKTTTLRLMAEAMFGQGVYIAFNKAIVEEAKQKFPSYVNCATSHSLAFRAVGHRYKHRLNGPRMKSWQIAKRLGLGPMPVETSIGRQILPPDFIAGMVMRGVRVFCMSADREISPSHIPLPTTMREDPELRLAFFAIRETLGPALHQAWADIRNEQGTLPFEHNAYLKLWWLEDPYIEADFILFDEAQDANGVTLAIVQAQDDHSQLIFVGDRYQQIYGWNGAVNAMERVPVNHRAWLTNSFRFGTEIADAANEVLSSLGAPQKIIGYGNPGVRGECAEPSIVLSRTNAGAVRGALDEIERGGHPHVVGGADDVVSFARAAERLQAGEMVTHPDLICFESWGAVKAYVKNDELGSDLALVVSIIDEFGAGEIVDLLSNQPTEKKATRILSTAHKAKGREWESVRLTGDLAKSGDEERRLRYVATTRAISHLDDVALQMDVGDRADFLEDDDFLDHEFAEADDDEPEPRRLVLTTLGEIARLHSVMTPPEFYRQAVADADRHAEEGGEPIDLLDERIAGLTAVREDYWKIINEKEEAADG